MKILLSATAALLLAAGLTAPADAAPVAAKPVGGLAARTVAQIDALAQAKLARTPTERKIDSKLLAADRSRRGLPPAAGVARVSNGVKLDAQGRTDVDIRASVSSALLNRITALGGQVRDSQPKAGSLRVSLPLAAVSALAASASVSRISVAMGAMTARVTPTPAPKSVSTPTKAQKDQLLRSRVAAALATKSAAAAGSTVSEGDRTHGARAARTQYKVSGIGITVGVLSDGVDSLAASIASGDLPSDTTVLPGQTGSGDEGTAMLEIVHDLAPKAKLAFATAFNGADSFASNIRALRAAGADIIVDDVIYFAESPFQDGPIAQAVIDVTDDGALYFSSAGNEQNVDDATAGNYEGNYVSSGQTIGKFAGTAHDFKPGSGVQVIDPLSEDSGGVPAILQWADPLGHAGDDYDLYAVDAAGNVVAYSNDVQDGNDDPFEGFTVPSGSLGLVVVKFSGANRYFQITAFRGRFAASGGLTPYTSPGVTRGHSAVKAAYSVAAVPADEPFGREIAPGVSNPSGPYPNSYTSAQTSERFTSDGPRRVFFNPDGSAITPGNFTSTGGEVRRKPDIAAADGVTTSVDGFAPFFGTSASAPHAAAIAALVLSGNPGITPGEVRTAITATALDIEAHGYDRDTGYGIIMAPRLLAYTGATPQPYAVALKPVVTPITGDGDAFLEPGESAKILVPVTNRGDTTAPSVSVQLTSPTPGVTLTPSIRSIGNVAAGATVKSARFTVRVPRSQSPGIPVELRIRVSFVGAGSPQVRFASIPVGQPSPTVHTVAYTGPPVAIPDADPVGADVSLHVSGVGLISRVTFSIDGATCSTDEGSTTVGIDHTYDRDLIGTLTGPSGQQVVLFSRTGGSGNNFCRTVFADAATAPIQEVTESSAPFTGSFLPAEPLAGFVGQTANGTWTFNVADQAVADTGAIRRVSLHVSGYVSAG